MRYMLAFYDSYYHDTKIGRGDSLTDILESWGCWLEETPWVIKKECIVDGKIRHTIVGRSAQYFDKEAK